MKAVDYVTLPWLVDDLELRIQEFRARTQPIVAHKLWLASRVMPTIVIGPGWCKSVFPPDVQAKFDELDQMIDDVARGMGLLPLFPLGVTAQGHPESSVGRRL